MNYTYYIIYSCYAGKMTVLLNGKTVLSQNSSILQYMNEPFYRWCNKLPELLYRELGENYRLIFTGRQEEAGILKKIMEDYPHCIHMEIKLFELRQTIQERMIGLSRLIREKNLVCLPPVNIEAVFMGSRSALQKWEGLIRQLEIRNQYCAVTIRTAGKHEEEKLSQKAVRFYLAESPGDIEGLGECVPEGQYAFILSEGIRDGFCRSEGNKFVYGITKQSFFQAVFECFLLFPLTECFSKYAAALMEYTKDQKVKQQIRLLLSEKPVIYAQAEERIERGCSVPFKIEMQPKGSLVPAITFEYQIPGIVTCTQQRIYGEKVGKTGVRVYEKGAAEPFAEFQFEVYERNRITAIDLSDYNQLLGVGDVLQLTCKYYPPDADNADKLTWYSDKKEIAVVSSSGMVTTKSAGKCKIYCAAEKVTAVCTLEIKPYLRSIALPFSKDETVQIEVGEEKQVVCITEPENAYDGKLTFGSSNLMVVNASGNTLIGVAEGEADITVENGSGRIRECFHVRVGRGNNPEPQPVKKKKFWGIFG